MTAKNSSSAEKAAATETLLEAKRCAVKKKDALKQAKADLKSAEEAWKQAREESRKATKLERKSQKRHDRFWGVVNPSKKGSSRKPAKPKGKSWKKQEEGDGVSIQPGPASDSNI